MTAIRDQTILSMTSGRSTCDGLDRPTLAEYSIDEGDSPFTMDDAGNGNSVNPPRRGNNVDDAIDNLTNRYNDRVDEAVTRKNRQPNIVCP